MTENRALDIVYDWLLKRNLSEALAAMEGYISSFSGLQDADRLYAIKADFQLMSDSPASSLCPLCRCRHDLSD